MRAKHVKKAEIRLILHDFHLKTGKLPAFSTNSVILSTNSVILRKFRDFKELKNSVNYKKRDLKTVI